MNRDNSITSRDAAAPLSRLRARAPCTTVLSRARPFPTAATLFAHGAYPHTGSLCPRGEVVSTATCATTDRRAGYGYVHSTSCVGIVKAVKIVSQERISEWIFDHVVDVSVPQVVGQLFVVPKISGQDRILQRTMEHISRCSSAADDRTVVKVPTSCFKREPSSGL